ncbi:MAG: hypothetical protein EOP09_17090, partial [Proteobacteria bacterium]
MAFNFTDAAQELIQSAQNLAIRKDNTELAPEHIFQSMLTEDQPGRDLLLAQIKNEKLLKDGLNRLV